MTLNPNFGRTAACALLALGAAAPAAAADPIALGSTYSQYFDDGALPGGDKSTLPQGWDFLEIGGDATYAAGTGSSNAGNTYSFGAASSTERAFGTLRSGSLQPTIGVFFTNGTGADIVGLDISYVGELWRFGPSNGRTGPDRLDFQYSTNATTLADGSWTDFDLLDFNTPNLTGSAGARDGNLAINQSALAGLIDVDIDAGQRFALRWVDADVVPGSDDGLAVDGFNLSAVTASAGAVPEPASWALMIAGFGLVGGAMRTRTRRQPIQV